MSEEIEDRVARIAEIVIGIGVTPVFGCALCVRRVTACPIHTGAKIASDLNAAGLLA